MSGELWRRRWRSATRRVGLGDNEATTPSTSSLVTRILDWLRAGYPEGVPGTDRVPLLALLHATPLSDEQVKEVVRNITADRTAAPAEGGIDRDEIAAFISEVTEYDAGPENINRVAAKLAAVGWPLAGISVQ